MHCEKCGSTSVQKTYKICPECHKIKKEYERAIYKKHKEKRVKKARKRYSENREQIRAQQKEFYQANKEEIKERSKEYYQNNKEKCKETSRRRYYTNWLQSEINKLRNGNWKILLNIKRNGQCKRCGESNADVLVFYNSGDGKLKGGLSYDNVKNLSFDELRAVLKTSILLCRNCLRKEQRRVRCADY